jgi:pilus assembly protein CpaC
MEVRIRIAEADYNHTVQVGKETIPGIRHRELDTAAMFKSGQALVIQGLVYTREESENVGVPYLSELPYAGAPFRKVETTKNELETIFVVRPEIVRSTPAVVTPTADLRNVPKPNTTRY